MARFKIISKDGGAIRFEGKPRYIGSYLKPSYLEFSEIASPTPIAWEVGDYVDYPRTGMRYRLFSIPQASKNARKGAHGRSFTYSNVQLYSATKELEIALFRDIVDNDNNIHFSTSPDVVTFENVAGIVRRIQACMNDLYPGRWEIRVADFDSVSDAEVIEKIAEAKDFALSGGTCLDALSKIYELWEDIGWFHSYENGKDIITVGYANRRNAENTSEPYLYGKGNGLTAIKKSQTNKDEFATRLYVYGSERNLPARYYNGKDILNAESVDIRNLMLPLDRWGKTNGKPDARLAYLENASAVERFGVIPKVHYFDSVDAGADIYPSIERMTIGQVRKALDATGETKYYPSENAYPDANLRVDRVRYCDVPKDNGELTLAALKHREKAFDEISGVIEPTSSNSASAVMQIFSESMSAAEPTACELIVAPEVSGYVVDKNYDSVTATLIFRDGQYNAPYNPKKTAVGVKNGDRWEFVLPTIKYDYAKSPQSLFNAYIDIEIRVSGDAVKSSTFVLEEGGVSYTLQPIQDKAFLIRLHEIGFNIDLMASKGNGKTISMKTGACAGRNFEIVSSRHQGGILNAQGYWDITCRRQQDDTLGLIFPNTSYGIAAGDEFVLLDIAMPESYVYAASDRLLAEGEKLLARASKIQSHYEPSIDAKVMIESGRTLREGMYMSVTDEDVIDNTTDYIIIDTLSIYEDESAIPTYKVTLRERRKVTYKGTPSATTSNDTKSVSDGSDAEVDLAGYAKESWVQDNISALDSKITKQGADIEKAKTDIDGHTREIADINDVLQYISVDKENNTLNIELNIATPYEVSAGGAGSEMEGEGVGGSLDSLSDVQITPMTSLTEEERASQVIGYSNGYWTNKKTMYKHNQSSASSKWTITHNLGKMPNVKVIDSTGELVFGTVVYDTTDILNKLTITFGGSFAGTAYLD